MVPVKFEGPFVPGATLHGRITRPGYEHVIMEITIETMDPERLFSYRWRPYARRSAACRHSSSDPRRLRRRPGAS